MESNLKFTIIKGREFKVVDNHFINEDDLFIEQYKQAAKMLNTIVNERDENAESKSPFMNEYENNIIAFCGERGEGKSSAMLTFINSLYDIGLEREEDFEKEFKRYNLFEQYRNLNRNHFADPIVVDPSQFDEVHNILDIILAKLYRNFMLKYEENNRCADEYITRQLQNQFQKVYREVSMINNQSKMLDDEFDYEGNIGKLSKLGESTGLKEDLQKLIEWYLEFIGKSSVSEKKKQYLIIAVDDLDLCNSNAYKMTEQIRKYLILPEVVIIMAVKVEQLELCVEEKTFSDFKEIVSASKLDNKERQSRIDTEIQNMSERYVAKLIPKARRIYLPKAQSLENVQVIYRTAENKIIWKSNEEESLVNAVLRLIRERTGMIFLSEESGISYLLPNNLRDMVNWIVFVADMPKIDDIKERDDVYLSNIKNFSQYFNGEWITRQVPGVFGNEMRLLETMDAAHMKLNTKWLLEKLYEDTDKKEDYEFVNVNAESKDDFWLVMQCFLRIKDFLYDYSTEQKVYGLKTLYTMKLNRYLRENGSNSLINRYLWGGEFEEVLPRRENPRISRTRFNISVIDAVKVVDDIFCGNIIEKLDVIPSRITVSNISQDENKRKDEIYSFLLIGMFFNLSVQNDEPRADIVLENHPLVFENRQIRKQIDISLENLIVNLMDFNKLIVNTNIERLGVKESEVLEIVKELKSSNKEIIELAQEIGSNMDVAGNIIDYCKKNKDYKSKPEDNRTINLVDKFIENICDFMKKATGKIYDYDSVKTIKFGEVNISISKLYANWFEEKIKRIEEENKEKNEQSQLAIDREVRKYEEKISGILNSGNIGLSEFVKFFRNDVTAERMKAEMDKFADDVSRYQRKHLKKTEGLNIEKICNLYREVLFLNNKGKNMSVTDKMKEDYKKHIGCFKEKIYTNELNEEANKK